jgi:hypothetical protein
MLIYLPILLSLDSLVAALALSVFRIERKRQIHLAIAFGVCDGLASLIRSLIAPQGNVGWLDSPILHRAVGGYLALVCVVWVFAAARPLTSSLLWTVPVVLSLDNLIGPGVEALSLGSVAAVAVGSAALSLLGFRLGSLAAEMAWKTWSGFGLPRRLTS